MSTYTCICRVEGLVVHSWQLILLDYITGDTIHICSYVYMYTHTSVHVSVQYSRCVHVYKQYLAYSITCSGLCMAFNIIMTSLRIWTLKVHYLICVVTVLMQWCLNYYSPSLSPSLPLFLSLSLSLSLPPFLSLSLGSPPKKQKHHHHTELVVCQFSCIAVYLCSSFVCETSFCLLFEILRWEVNWITSGRG